MLRFRTGRSARHRSVRAPPERRRPGRGMIGPPPSVDVVVPTIGRPSLAQLLTRLGSAPGLGEVIVVDDRRDQFRGLPMGAAPETLGRRLRVVSGRAAGP